MTLPLPKWAVYYGTIRLIDGSLRTFTPLEVAELYGVEGESYLSVPLIGPSPFANSVEELSYYHLKPMADDRQYFNAIDRYNTNNEIQWDEDFDGKKKYAIRPQFDNSEDA